MRAHLVQQELLLNIGSHSVPEGSSHWEASKSQVMHCAYHPQLFSSLRPVLWWQMEGCSCPSPTGDILESSAVPGLALVTLGCMGRRAGVS